MKNKGGINLGISALRDLSKKVKTSDVNIDLKYGLNSSSN